MGITIRSTDGNYSNIYYADGGGNAQGYVSYQHSTDSLQFATATNERMRIDSSGRLLLGTTTEGVSTGDTFTIATSSSTGMTLRSGTSNEGNIFFSDGTSGADEYRGSIQYNHGSNFLTIGTDGSERLRIDSSGRLIVGTDTASSAGESQYSLLEVSGNTSGATGSGLVTIKKGEAASAMSDGDTIGRLIFAGKTGGDFAQIQVNVDGSPSGNDFPGNMRFNICADGASAPAERMRIDSSGRLLVGRTSNITSNSVATCHVLEQITDFNWTFGLHCNQTNKVGMTVYYTDTTNNLDCFRFMVASSTKFVVSGSGNVSNANNSYGSVSDVALKENIVDAKSQWNDLKNIKVRNFNFKESTGNHGKTMIGVVAQEVETVSPKLIHTNDAGFKEVSYSVLYMKAIKALQEAQARIETLETKVAALEAA